MCSHSSSGCVHTPSCSWRPIQAQIWTCVGFIRLSDRVGLRWVLIWWVTGWVGERNKKLSYRMDSARCGWNCHSGSLKVIRRCANRRGMTSYQHLVVTEPLYSTVLEISRLVCSCTSMPRLSSRWNWKKTTGSRWRCVGVGMPRALHYPTINLSPR